MNVDLRQLRYFVAVAEELHFARAAERVFVSQPALSHQIKALEETLGVQLLRRTKRKVELTAAGRTLLGVAKRVLGEVEAGLNEVRRVGGAAPGRLRVGLLFTEHAASGPVAELLEDYKRRVPHVVLELHEVLTGDMTRQLHDGRLDVGFTHAPVDGEGLAAVPLGYETFRVALAKGHRLAGRDELPLSALADEGILFPPREPVPDKFDELTAACRRAGFEPKLLPAPGNLEASLAVVATGRAVCLVPSYAAAAHSDPEVSFSSLSSPSMLLNLVAVRRRDAPLPLVALLLELLAER